MVVAAATCHFATCNFRTHEWLSSAALAEPFVGVTGAMSWRRLFWLPASLRVCLDSCLGCSTRWVQLPLPTPNSA